MKLDFDKNQEAFLAHRREIKRQEKELVKTARKLLEKNHLSAFAFVKIAEANHERIF